MKGPIAWFVRNPVAANLVMLIIVFGGISSMIGIDNQMFPNISPRSVKVTLAYPGAGPQEVEEQVCIRIEEAISDLEGIRKINSIARQGHGEVVIEATQGWDLQRLLNDVKSRVDAINTFPADAERPAVSEVTQHAQVMNLAVAGDLGEANVKALAEAIREDLTRIRGVSRVDLKGVREAEVSVEISEETLRAYNLGFGDIAQAIRDNSINLPAGQVRNEAGDIQIQTYGQAYRGEDFSGIPVVTHPDGSQVLLGEIADIRDGFRDINFLMLFNGKPAAQLEVYVGENPDFLGVSAAVREYVAREQALLPEGVVLDTWFDFSVHLKDRLNLLLENALQGLLLVFVLLMLFLRPILAFWVTAGIAIAYLGAVWLMPALGIPVSVVSTFAFILILGIVVDDAIVVGESIYARYEDGLPGPAAAARGTAMVSKPVTFAVLTTIVVFLPMLFLPGNAAEMFYAIPGVAVAALGFSLVESFFILPSHLRHMKPEREPRFAVSRRLHRLRHRFSAGLRYFCERWYLPLLDGALARKGATLAAFAVAFWLAIALAYGGWIVRGFMPNVEGELLHAHAELEEGVGFGRTLGVMDRLESSVTAMQDSGTLVNDAGIPIIDNRVVWVSENNVWMLLGLISNEERKIGSSAIAEQWKLQIGKPDNIENLTVNSNMASGGDRKDITLLLRGRDNRELVVAAAELGRLLGTYPGVFNVTDDLSNARKEIRISLKPYAETLGIGLADVARQVRYAFYGAEAQRIPRLREDVRVLVRYPKSERRTLDSLEDMRIRTPDGREVPFSAVAEAEFAPGYTTIRRLDRERTVKVEADVLDGVGDPGAIVKAVMVESWPGLQGRFPGVTLGLDGEQKDQREFMSSLLLGFAFSVLLIYTLMAVEFRSYWQPLVILSAVPFGIAGALYGHFITGLTLSIPSFLGILATAGVVVNDNLVLMDRINSLRREGVELVTAVRQGARGRLRPIVLTSLTTFLGLTPILLETSVSAQFLKPMVVSLAFGVLFATTLTLILVPVMYTAGEQFKIRCGLKMRAESSLDIEGMPEA